MHRPTPLAIGCLLSLCGLSLYSPLSPAMEMMLDELLEVAEEETTEQLTGKCHRVVDGDSLYLQGNDTQIRLWGVDAPEREEKGYQRATDSLRKMAQGKQLRCEQQDIDKYGRIVARCFVKESGLELNRRQIESGVADEYCRFTRGYYGHCR